jgi:hypothetical protein
MIANNVLVRIKAPRGCQSYSLIALYNVLAIASFKYSEINNVKPRKQAMQDRPTQGLVHIERYRHGQGRSETDSVPANFLNNHIAHTDLLVRLTNKIKLLRQGLS